MLADKLFDTAVTRKKQICHDPGGEVSIPASHDFHDFPRSNQHIGCFGVGLVMGSIRILIEVVVDQIFLDKNSKAMS
jgi:hypothetical protein